MLAADRYLTGAPATFAQGDFNGDGVFDQRDLVIALQTGQFRSVGMPAMLWLGTKHSRPQDDGVSAVEALFAELSQ